MPSPGMLHNVCLQFCGVALNACVVKNIFVDKFSDLAAGLSDQISGAFSVAKNMKVNGRSLEDAQNDQCAASYLACRENTCGDTTMTAP